MMTLGFLYYESYFALYISLIFSASFFEIALRAFCGLKKIPQICVL